MKLYSPAKINLTFKILNKREDGYHNIHSKLIPISIYDKITIKINKNSKGFTLNCNDKSIPIDNSNLITKSVLELEKESNYKFNVTIDLEKNIPHSAGLGGGSGNAATTLKAINSLFKLNYSKNKLCKIAARIGSDVPFFIYETECICESRGEKVTPILKNKSSLLNILLLKPEFGISASDAYKRYIKSKHYSKFNYKMQFYKDHTFVNDLEYPVFEKFPFLGELKNYLLEQEEVAVSLLSGSGSTLLCVIRDKYINSINLLKERISKDFGEEFWFFLARTIN